MMKFTYSILYPAYEFNVPKACYLPGRLTDPPPGLDPLPAATPLAFRLLTRKDPKLTD